MSNKPARTVKCPTCGKQVEWKPENRYRPFCSERCRQIDLGAWASENYRVPAEAPPDADKDVPRD
ncbi:DNA gyrase inhibitor YacG [Pseudothauera rhizosphaerae]|uniref:DNA gyrase inhibitor YacG n=1 Tax=Pseudothauera rhizosphaerae TaxID=2565932 RepID=A0A4S4ANP4_9RHOO|nr:DNA gyrase inhibitor YacG [Pseudothauera rhizosphaerae]THF61265.1 DNA gyrase inhibitor YacG [Pseudothauera rhizosphaerae]